MNSRSRRYQLSKTISTAMYLGALWLSVNVTFAQPPALNPQQQTVQPANQTAVPGPTEGSLPGPPVEPLHFPGEALFNGTPPFLTGVTVDRQDGIYQEGQKLRIQFLAEREAYLYLIYHQADGVSLLLFPNLAQKSNRVAAGKPMIIPASEKDLRIRIQAPFGREVLQVLATTEPMTELDSLVGRSNQFPVVTQELIASLGQRLLKDASTWTEHRVPIRTLPKEAIPVQRKAQRVGLFIGIGQYLHPEFAPTHEELGHSAEVMHDLMLKHGQLDPQRTQLVMNEQATKANLQELITKWLPSVSEPGDTVFIYFSGHAGQFETTDAAEPSRMEQSIGPYDLNAGEANLPANQRTEIYRSSNLSASTLARWLQELQGRQIVFILDTCHSGGLFRSKGFEKNFMAARAKQMKALAQMNMLVLASCAADEQSLFEGTKNKTMWFTYCLTEAIEAPDSPRPLTVQATHEYSRQRMRTLLREGNAGREQEPQMTDTALLPIDLIPK